MSSRTRSTSSRSPARGCLAALWLTPFVALAATAYAIRGIAAAAIVCVVFAVASFFALRARKGYATLPLRADSCLPRGWASAGARFTGGGSTGSW